MAPSSSLVLTTYLLKNAEFHPILADLCPSSQEYRGLPSHENSCCWRDNHLQPLQMCMQMCTKVSGASKYMFGGPWLYLALSVHLAVGKEAQHDKARAQLSHKGREGSALCWQRQNTAQGLPHLFFLCDTITFFCTANDAEESARSLLYLLSVLQ